MVDPAKYRALFVTESREILNSFQQELLRFERGEDGRESVDAMFRAAHSLKGMAASMGYTGFAELAHAMEDLAADARGEGSLPTEAVDLLLEGGDRLSESVDSMEAGAEEAACDAADLIDRIRVLHQARARAARAATPPGGGSPSSPTPVDPSAPEAGAGAASSEALVRLAVRFSEQAQAPQVRAFMLQRQVAQQFDLVELAPPVDDLRAGRFPDRRLTLTVRAGAEAQAALVELARGFTDVEQVEILGGPRRRKSDAPTAEPDAADAQRTVRVRTEILDEFIDSVGELLRARDRLRDVAGRLQLPELSEIADELVGLTKDLYDRVMMARMTPLSLLTERLPRVVRDLARRSERRVELRIEGADIELDRALLDELHSAVLHIVRNSVDHGHDGRAARLAAGKPEALSLVVRARRDRDHVLIEVEDDGRGIDPEAIKAKALASGVIDEARAAALSHSEALELICAPGLSTAAEVTDVSGRGVGMDAVRSSAERLGGDLQIASELGTGTCFTLRLPLTMAIIGVMLVQVGETLYAIPTSRVGHARDFDPSHLGESCGERLLRVDGELLQYFDLGDLLGYDGQQQPEESTVILLEDAGGRSAVRVDRIAGLQEVVVKPLGTPLARLDYLAGAALLADGEPVFILDVGRLVRREVVVA